MELTNKKKDTKSLQNIRLEGKQKNATVNIPFFWSSEYYLKENVYCTIKMISFIIFIILAIVAICLFIAKGYPETTSSSDMFGDYRLTVCFFASMMMFTSLVCWWNQFRISRKRKNEYISSKSREIKIDNE